MPLKHWIIELEGARILVSRHTRRGRVESFAVVLLTWSEAGWEIAGVRLSPDERRALERAAAERDLTLSEWMREVLLETAGVHANTNSPMS